MMSNKKTLADCIIFITFYAMTDLRLAMFILLIAIIAGSASPGDNGLPLDENIISLK